MSIELPHKRDAIIAAAIKLIAEYGFHGTPISLIAQEAEVGAGTIYRYFADKDALVREIFLQVHAEFNQALLLGYDEGRPIRDRFFHLCRGIFRYGMDHPFEFKFIEQFCHSPYGIDLRREKLFCKCIDTGADLPLKEVLDAGQRQQVIKDLPLPALLALAIGPIVFLVKDNIAGLVQLDEAGISAILAACWDGVKR